MERHYGDVLAARRLGNARRQGDDDHRKNDLFHIYNMPFRPG